MKAPRRYLGAITGTSVDGIDTALVEMTADGTPRFVAGHTEPLDAGLQHDIRKLISGDPTTLEFFGSVDQRLGKAIAAACLALLESEQLPVADVAAVGSHGQTVWHAPRIADPFTLQVGDPNQITALTGIPVVADLRRFDMALGGEGAPLVPAFHRALFADPKRFRVVGNLGGIANLTLIPPGGEPLAGFDTGPANALLDAWTERQRGEPFDRDGEWAASGRVDEPLLDWLLREPYFALPAPKSTGKERFNAAWLDATLELSGRRPAPADVAATLVELTARTVADAVMAHAPVGAECFLCGGGVRNKYLMQRLRAVLPDYPVGSSAVFIDPDFVEAAAMAYLAWCRLEDSPATLASVTGARRDASGGAVYRP